MAGPSAWWKLATIERLFGKPKKDRVRTAVVGVGAFGRNHARVLAESENAELVAVVDPNPEHAGEVARERRCEALADWRELAGRVDAVCLAAPTALHAEIGVGLLEAGLDVLVEKPIAADLAGADRLIETAERRGRILQVGHLERFNPAVEAACEVAELPLFFEVHRLGTFSPRSLDVDVLLDLMIHDLDLLLALVDSPIDRIEASGIPILSKKADIANVRIVFENGCVANLTASRISTDRVRKLRFFQPRQYVSVDYARQDAVVIGLGEANRFEYQQIRPERAEPLAKQIGAFLASVQSREEPLVSGRKAREALSLALRIRDEMDRHAELVTATVAAHQKARKT